MTGSSGFRPGGLLVAILVVAFSVRVAAAIYWELRVVPRSVTVPAQERMSGQNDGPFFFGDSDSYWKLGRAVAFGRSYEFDEECRWTVFRMPGYPFLLAPLFWLGGENPATLSARVLNCFLGTISVALVALLAEVIFRRRAITLLAAALAALEPCLIAESILILSEGAFQVALLLQLIVLATLLRRKSHGQTNGWDAIALGMTSALAVYFRPSWLYFAPLVLIPAILFAYGAGRNRWGVATALLKDAMVSCVIFVLCMMPWWIRNAVVTQGHFVPTTLQMGASLYDGWSPDATGASQMDFVAPFRRAEISASGETHGGPFETRLNDRMKEASLTWAWGHPDRVVKLAGVKFLRLWNVVPNESGFSKGPVRLAVLLSWVPVLVLGLIGAFCQLGRTRGLWLLLMPALYLTFLHVIFVSSIRYRIPAIPCFLVLTAWTLVTLVSFVKKPSSRRESPWNTVTDH